MTGSNLKTSGDVEALELRLARSRNMGSLQDERRLPAEENSKTRGPARTTQDALTFLKLVKDTFQDDDGKYKELLQILKNFQTKTICTGKLVSQVKTLFVAHPRLLTGMNGFLPTGYQICDPVENSRSAWEASHVCTDGTQQQVSTGREEVEETLPPPPAAPPVVSPGSPPSSSPFEATATTPSPCLEKQPCLGKHASDLQRALNFVNKVKVRFQDERHLFQGFLEVLNLYREAGLETQELVSKITALFVGHVDLMDDFYRFLPATSQPPHHQPRVSASNPSSHAQGRSSPSRHNRGVLPQNRVHSKKAAGGAASKRAGSPPTATVDCWGREEALENGTVNHSPCEMKSHPRQTENDFENFGASPAPSLLPVTKRRRTSIGDQDYNDSGRDALPEEAIDQSSLQSASLELPSVPTLQKKPPCNKCQECLRRRGNAAGLDGRNDGEGVAGTERRGSPCSLSEQQPHEECFPPLSLEATPERDIDMGERQGDQTDKLCTSRSQGRGPDDATERVIAEVSQTPSFPDISQGIEKLQFNANGEAERNDAGRSSSELNHRQPKIRKQQHLNPDGKAISKEAMDHDYKADGKQDLETEQLNLLTSRKLPRSTPTKTSKTKGTVLSGSNTHHQSVRAEPAKKGEKSGGACVLKDVARPLFENHEADEENRSSPTSPNADSDESAREKLVYFRPKLGKREQKEKIDKRYSETGGTHGNNSNDSNGVGRKISASRGESVLSPSSSPPREEKRRRSPDKKTDKLERTTTYVSRRPLDQDNCSPKLKRRRGLETDDKEDNDDDTAHQNSKEKPLEGVHDEEYEPTLQDFSQNCSAKIKQGLQLEDLQHQKSRRQNSDGVHKVGDEPLPRPSFGKQSPTGSKNGTRKCKTVDQENLVQIDGGLKHGDDDGKTDQSASDESEKENQKQPPLAANDSSQKVPQKRSSARLAHELLRKQCRTTERVGQGGPSVAPSSARLSGEEQKLLELRQLEEKKQLEVQLKQRKVLEEMKFTFERLYASSVSRPKCLREFSEQVLSCPKLQTVVTQFQEDQELEYSQCKKATVSYYLLPKSYIKPLASCRTRLDRAVLNDEWVSAGYDSEGKDNSQDESCGGRKQIGREGSGKRAPHDKRLYHEERLFLCEDDQFELDLLRHTAASTIKRLEDIVEMMKAPDFCVEALDWDDTLSPVHVRCIERVYGDYGADLIEVAKKKPVVALPVILGRLKQKQEVDWPDYQKEMNKTWAEVRAEHFHKSLTYSPSGKQSDKTQPSYEELFMDSHCDEDEELKCDNASADERAKDPDAEVVYNIVKYLLKDMCMSGEQFNIFHGLWSSHVGSGGSISGQQAWEPIPEEAGGVAVSNFDDG